MLTMSWYFSQWSLKNLFVRVFPGKRAIGLYPIFADIKDEDVDVCKKAVNYNVTNDAPGHMYFGPNCNIFMSKVKDAYWDQK